MRKYECTYDGPEEFSDGCFVNVDDVEDLIREQIAVLEKRKLAHAQSGSEYGEGITRAQISTLEKLLEEILE